MNVSYSFATVSYIASIALFILSLGGLSQHESSRRGNMFGIIGMLLALIATVVLLPSVTIGFGGSDYAMLAVPILIAAVIGATLASRVAMTSMPELVAMLHSFVGAAAVLVALRIISDRYHSARKRIRRSPEAN